LAAINELLRSKLLAAGILADYYVACWRVVFRLDDYDPDHQDVEADADLYAAGSRRCLLSCNDIGQRRPFIFKAGRRAAAQDVQQLSRHGRRSGGQRAAGASIQWDLVGIAAPGGGGGSVSGRGILKTQPVPNFFATLWMGHVGQTASAPRLSS
jgi:hypothetical protein